MLFKWFPPVFARSHVFNRRNALDERSDDTEVRGIV